MRNPNAHFRIRHGRMTRASGYTNRDRKNAQDWSIMDVEDLRDFAKTMTIDDLTIIMARSRHEIQKKLIELGLSAVKSPANDTDES
jgi:hypothetical protein